MIALRKALFWLHLAVGVTAGSVVLVMAVTGAALAFQPQILAFAERGARNVTPASESAPLPASSLVAAAEAPGPRRATSVTLSAKPTDAASVGLGRETTLFVDPYTGRVVGEGSRAARGFFRVTTDIHRWLGVSEARRGLGRAVTGAANAGFFLLALSGLYLWWPRQWTARNVRNAALFQRGLAGRARDFNWHSVIGLWSSAVLIVITATGMVMSYRWANDLLYTLTGSTPPPAPAAAGSRNAGRDRAAGADRDSGSAAARPDYDRLFDAARRQAPDWKTITLRLPQGGGPITASIERGESWNPYARSQLTLDPATAAVAKWEPYASASAGRRLRVWARGLHTGEPGRVAGQAAAGLASLGAAVLVWTGYAMAWRRWRAWARRRAVARSAAANAPERERAAG